MCGEPSGDAILYRVVQSSAQHGYRLLGGVYTSRPTFPAPAFDGPKELGVLGVGLDLVRALPNAVKRLRQTVKLVDDVQPDLLLTVDAKGFCLRLQSRAMNVKRKVHVCAPSIWAFHNGPKRAESIPVLDAMVMLLPFESAFWRLAVKCESVRRVPFVGYSAVETLLDAVGRDSDLVADDLGEIDFAAEEKEYAKYARRFKNSCRNLPLPHEVMDDTASMYESGRLPVFDRAAYFKFRGDSSRAVSRSSPPTLLLLPGSRRSVIYSTLPIMENVLKSILARSLPSSEFHVMVLNDSVDRDMDATLLRWMSTSPSMKGIKSKELVNDKLLAFASADAALASSGTIVTESLLFQIPTVVMFNSGGCFTEWAARRASRLHSVTLCNIMAGHEIVPEFLFSELRDAQLMASEVARLLFNRSEASALLEQCNPILRRLCRYSKDGSRVLRPSRLISQVLNDLGKGLEN